MKRGEIYVSSRGEYRKVTGIQTAINNHGKTVIDEIQCLEVDQKGVAYSHKQKCYQEKAFNARFRRRVI